MNLLIMGPAGSGKGTVSSGIVENFKLTHISTGDMFREAIANETPVGVEAKQYIDQGKLVPDEVTNRLVEERLNQEQFEHGYLLDGFPRNLAQAEALEQITDKDHLKIDLVLHLDVAEEELIRRITGRRLCKDCGAIYHIDHHPSEKEGVCDVCGGELYQRSDDTEEKFKVRHKAYLEQTQPVIDFYREKGLVKDIDGGRKPEEVMNDVLETLGALK